MPYHILCSKGTKKVEKEIQALLDASPYGADAKIYINKEPLKLKLQPGGCDDRRHSWQVHHPRCQDTPVRFGFPIFEPGQPAPLPLMLPRASSTW